MFEKNIIFKKKIYSGANSTIFHGEFSSKGLNSLFYKDIKDNFCVKISNKSTIIEKSILEKAEGHDFIVQLLGFGYYNIDKFFLIFPVANNDLTNIQIPVSKEILTKLIDFFENSLKFLKENNVVYLDWKPANILDFGNMNFKLSDFGSCQIADKVLNQHPKNINLNFCSPYVMDLFDNTKLNPKYQDDEISVGYLLLYFQGYKIPWSFLEPLIEKSNEIQYFTSLVFELKTNYHLHYINTNNYIIPEQIKNKLLEIYELNKNFFN